MLKVLAFVLLVSVARADEGGFIRFSIENHYKKAGGTILPEDKPKIDAITVIAKEYLASKDKAQKLRTEKFLELVEAASVAEDKSGNKNSIFTPENIKSSYEKYGKDAASLKEFEGVLNEYTAMINTRKVAADQDTLAKAANEYVKKTNPKLSDSDMLNKVNELKFIPLFDAPMTISANSIAR